MTPVETKAPLPDDVEEALLSVEAVDDAGSRQEVQGVGKWNEKTIL